MRKAAKVDGCVNRQALAEGSGWMVVGGMVMAISIQSMEPIENPSIQSFHGSRDTSGLLINSIEQ